MQKCLAAIQVLDCCSLDSFLDLKEVPGLETVLTHQAFPLLLPQARPLLFSVVKPHVLNNSQPCYPALYVPNCLRAIAALVLS